MLAQTVMQVLPNSALLPGAYIKECLFLMLSLRDVDAGGDDVTGCSPSQEKR